MRFIPQAITSYTSTQIVPEYATWSNSTTYVVGNKVIYDKYIWICSYAGSLNFQPQEDSPHWTKMGVSNYYSLIDTRSQTKTVCSTDLIVEFPLGLINTIAIGYFQAETIKIENLSNTNVVLDTQIYNQSPNENVFDYFDYIYEPYSFTTDKAKYWKIKYLGTKLRISFLKGSYSSVFVGFMVGGIAVDMGKTVENVKLGWQSFSLRTTDDFGIMSITKRADQDLMDFETAIDTVNLMSFRKKAKQYKDEIVAFIIDDTESSMFENIVTLGVMPEMQVVASNFDKTILTWSILESI